MKKQTKTTKAVKKQIHTCKYCGRKAEGQDTDLLCMRCSMIFGHSRYSQL